MILLRLLVSRFLLPAVSSPQTENTRSTMPQMQELTAGPEQVEPTVGIFISIRDPEFKSAVF